MVSYTSNSALAANVVKKKKTYYLDVKNNNKSKKMVISKVTQIYFPFASPNYTERGKTTCSLL